jgi:hypothetical protein
VTIHAAAATGRPTARTRTRRAVTCMAMVVTFLKGAPRPGLSGGCPMAPAGQP